MTAPVLIGTPIVTSRQWTTALAPRVSGGWMFICQSYENGVDVPSEWIRVALEAGTYAITEGPNFIYANSNYQIPSTNTLVVDNNQIRASNGRVFFLMAADHAGGGIGQNLITAYYSPTDEDVHYLPNLFDTTGNRHAITYSSVFNHAGTVIYAGTQALIGFNPIVFSINPSTLAQAVIGVVGSAVSANPKYAYYLGKDEGPGAAYLYVAVGQDPWELVAINVSTGVQTVLYTTGGVGLCTMNLDALANGWRATVVDNGVTTYYWVADGAIEAYPGGGAPSGGARTVTPYSNALVAPPEIDWSRGIGQVLWRANGSSGAFTEIDYTISYKAGVNLESLATLTDGTVLGNAEQYNGFFRKSGTSTLTWYGAWPLGVSQPVLLSVSDSLIYIAGYPNGALYSYDPSAAWNPGASNPLALGDFHATSGVKYTYFLELGANGRLYQSGRRERDSSGSGIGYYDPVGATFSGVTAAPLDNYIPRGTVVLDGISRVVFSGETIDGSDANLLVYDLDLNAITSWPVQAGIKNTGLLFETSDPAIIVGMTNDAPYYLYRINISTGAVLSITTLGGAVGASAIRSTDNSLWVMIGTTLTRIDLETLATYNVQTISGVTLMAWSQDGRTLYLTETADLYRRATLTLIDPNILKPEAEVGFADTPLEFYDVLIGALNDIAQDLGTIATIDVEILRPTSSTGSAESVPDFFNVSIAKINEIIDSVPATPHIDPDLLVAEASAGAATSVPDFHDVLIAAVNSIIGYL